MALLCHKTFCLDRQYSDYLSCHANVDLVSIPRDNKDFVLSTKCKIVSFSLCAPEISSLPGLSYASDLYVNHKANNSKIILDQMPIQCGLMSTAVKD